MLNDLDYQTLWQELTTKITELRRQYPMNGALEKITDFVEYKERAARLAMTRSKIYGLFSLHAPQIRVTETNIKHSSLLQINCDSTIVPFDVAEVEIILQAAINRWNNKHGWAGSNL